MHPVSLTLAAGHIHTAATKASSWGSEFASGYHAKPIGGPLPGFVLLLILAAVLFAVIRSAARRQTSSNR